MPGYDRTGPEGKGQGTGRKSGPCYNEKFEQDQFPQRMSFRKGAGLNDKIGQPQGRGLGRGLGPCGQGLGLGRRGRW